MNEREFDVPTYPLEWNALTQGFTKGNHNGIDEGWSLLHGGREVPVYSIYKGIVHLIMNQHTGGNVLILKHIYNGKIYYSEYGHLKDGSITKKVGDTVLQGEQIGIRGNTGYYWNGKKWVQVPYHLHLGIYESDQFSYDKNKWIDPTKFLYIAPWQTASKDTIKDYNINFVTNKYGTGIYECLYNMNLRSKPSTNSAIVKVEDLTNLQKEACTNQNPKSRACFKQGTKFTALEVIKNNEGYWARSYNIYICIDDNVYQYCKKL